MQEGVEWCVAGGVGVERIVVSCRGRVSLGVARPPLEMGEGRDNRGQSTCREGGVGRQA